MFVNQKAHMAGAGIEPTSPRTRNKRSTIKPQGPFYIYTVILLILFLNINFVIYSESKSIPDPFQRCE